MLILCRMRVRISIGFFFFLRSLLDLSLRKVWTPLSALPLLPLWVKWEHISFSTRIALALNNSQSLTYHWTKKPKNNNNIGCKFKPYFPIWCCFRSLLTHSAVKKWRTCSKIILGTHLFILVIICMCRHIYIFIYTYMYTYIFSYLRACLSFVQVRTISLPVVLNVIGNMGWDWVDFWATF